MPPKKKSLNRWEFTHTKALRELFTSGVADPQKQTPHYIESVFLNLPEDSCLKKVPYVRFVAHYKEKAAAFITGKAVEGIRRSESSFVIQVSLIRFSLIACS